MPGPAWGESRRRGVGWRGTERRRRRRDGVHSLELQGVGDLGEELPAHRLEMIGYRLPLALVSISGVEHRLPIELVGKEHRGAKRGVLGADCEQVKCRFSFRLDVLA